MSNLPIPVQHRPWCDQSACEFTDTGAEGRHLGPATVISVPGGSVSLRLCEELGEHNPTGALSVQLELLERRAAFDLADPGELIDGWALDVTTTAELSAAQATHLGAQLQHLAATAHQSGD